MRVPYRVTSSLVIAGLVLLILSSYLPPPKEDSPSLPDGTVQWDPCNLWVTYTAMHSLQVLISFAAILLFGVQGMRNRTGPRWLAIAGLLAFIPVVEDTWWTASARCDGNPHPIALLIWYGCLALMLLHHALQPADRQSAPPESRIVTLLGDAVLLAFLSTLLVSFCVRQFEQFWRGDLRDMPRWVSAAKATLTPPAYALFISAIGVTIFRTVNRRPVAEPRIASPRQTP